jgi:molybdopterin molybdotransferase
VKRFLDLVTADEATQHLAAFAASRTETIDARRALGRVTAGEVHAREDVPHFFRSNMDGYAVRAEDTQTASPTSAVALSIVGTVLMGEIPSFRVEPGTAARISTGGMMPEGADAVVIVERTEELPRERVAIREGVAPRDSTIAIGEDLRAGDSVFPRGHRFRATDVGVLTGIGHSRVEVFCMPRAAVIATGDEIVEPEAPLPPGRVRNVNEYLLSALALRNGAVVNDYGVIGDDLDLLRGTIERALAESDAVFISGGSSKGAKDSTRAAIEAIAGAEILFHGISIAPGKPTLLAKLGEKAIMGVPGNPAAVAVSFTLFGGPLLGVLGGEPLERILLRRPRCRARIAAALAAADGRDDYVRVRLEAAGVDLPHAEPQRGKSVALSTLARASGLVRVAAGSKGFLAGDEVEVLLLD